MVVFRMLSVLPGMRRNRRGAVAVTFGLSLTMLMIGTISSIEVSRLTASKSALQRIADNAALTGAAMYTAYTASDSFKTLAETMATSSFCNAAAALPAGASLTTPKSGTIRDCGNGTGPTAVGQITGYKVGTRGLAANSGCTATATVAVSPIKCAFAVTVTAQARLTGISNILLGPMSVSVTATAVNPFIDLSKALNVQFVSAAENANSVWVYPVVLNDSGQPDFTVNPGALPDRSTCSGDPLQFNCGNYTMLASNHFGGCSDASPCIYGSTIVGSNGTVKNPVTSTAVITATTPLGFAFVSTANANNTSLSTWYGPCQDDTADLSALIPDRVVTAATMTAGGSFTYKCDGTNKAYTFPRMSDPKTGCVYPYSAVYNTFTQMFKKDGAGVEQPLMPWSYSAHFFYSSYLNNNLSPQQVDLDLQGQTGQIVVGGRIHNKNQVRISPVEDDNAPNIRAAESNSKTCTPLSTTNGISTYPEAWYIYKATTYETPRSNCALIILKDSATNLPSGSYLDSRPNVRSTAPFYNTCFSPDVKSTKPTPGNTPGAQYGIIQCQNFKGHTFTYLFNDASGKADDTDYGNGGVLVKCSSNTNVVLVD